MSQDTLQPEADPGIWYATAAATQVALAEDILDAARTARARAADELHTRHGWSFRRLGKLLHVSEAAVRLMIAKHQSEAEGPAL